MRHLKVRPVDFGELDEAREIVGHLTSGDEALRQLERLGDIPRSWLKRGDGWAAAAEVDGTGLFLRGEPVGGEWSIHARPESRWAAAIARKLRALIGLPG